MVEEETINSITSINEETTLNTTEVSDKKVYSRDELVFLAKLYDRAEHFEEAVEYSVNFIKMKPILNADERQCFSNAFKNLYSMKRTSMKYLENLIKKEKKAKNIKNESNLQEIILKIEMELNSLINLIQELIDELLLPNSKKIEAQVFYLKLKGDYYRYKAEFSKDEEKEISVDLAEQAYNEAYMLSEEQLPITSLIRVSLAVNFSLFYYQEKNMIDEAIMLAKSCFDEAIKMVDEVEEAKARDYILLVHLLKENIIFWNTEKSDEENVIS